jgi:hypothetical protein
VTNLKGGSVDVEFLQPTDGIYKESAKPLVEVSLDFVFSIIEEPPVPVSGRGSLSFPEWKKLQSKYQNYKLKYF